MGHLDQVRVARRFQRAIRIDTDLEDSRALDGFVCPSSLADVLLSTANHVRETRQGAFTWTGPYGTGKSSLLVVLSALLSGNSSLRLKAEGIVGSKVSKKLQESLPPLKNGWQVLPVVGRREAPAVLLGEALVARGLTNNHSIRRWSDSRVIETISKIAGASPRSSGGLVVILDEMGQCLEAAAQDGLDIYLFQQLAEIASRSNGRLIFIGVLHQAFDEYAQRLSRVHRDEWAKIQGRFVDMVLNVTGDEQLELLSRAIEIDQAVPQLEIASIVAQVVRSNRAASKSLDVLLRKCWPLHPVVSCLLGPISRRRFGQNQRSLFGFLCSAEPFGFQDFLRNASDVDLYTPGRLWDYLRANLEPAILASPDGHRWSMAVEAVERCYGLGASDLHIQLLKTIALIDIFRERSGLLATQELLASVISSTSASALGKVLKDLVAWSFVLYRKHLSAYAIYAGSDFDIEGALSQAMEASPEISFKDLRDLAGLQPILAKRHYHETGSLRWFDVDLVSLSEIEVAVGAAPPEGGAMGRFLLAIPAAGEILCDASKLCRRVVNSTDDDVVVGLSGHAWQVVQLAREFLAMNRIREERPELAGDAVARREVLARIADLRTRLEADLQRMFDSAEWFSKGRHRKRCSMAALNALASSLADARFSKCSLLPNELINRTSPSSNAVAAQKALLKRMAQGQGQPRLGIEGFPPEGGLCDSILLKAGLYAEDPEQGWRFVGPDSRKDPCRLAPVWKAAIALVTNSRGRVVSMSDIYHCWKEAPFGVKEGLSPVLGVAFILANSHRLAFYREGVFQARFTDLDVDYLTSDPASIQVRWMNLSELSRRILSGLATVVRSLAKESSLVHLEPIDVARGLVQIYEELKPYTKRTSRLSSNAIAVRSLFKQASDPNKFLFDDIPNLFNNERQDTDSVETGLELVRQGLEELVSAYGSMLGRLRELMLAELQVPNASPQAFQDLRSRAANIQQLGGDFRLNAFIVRLMEFQGSELEMEGIASLAVSKPPRDWVDADLDQAALEIALMAHRFVRDEAYARVKGRPDKRQAMAVVVGINGRPTPISGEFDVPDHDRASVEVLVPRLERAISGAECAKRNVILAALAEISVRYLEEGAPQQGSSVKGDRKRGRW